MTRDNHHTPFDSDPNPFGLPEDYFKGTAASILRKVEWLEEHKDLPLLTELKQTSGFRVPEHYFSDGGSTLELVAYPRLMALEKKSGFHVPDLYFEEAELNELARVIGDSEDPALTVPKQQPFALQAGYFANNSRILSGLLIPEGSEVRVFHLFRAKAWLAAAALLTLALGIWAYNVSAGRPATQDCGSIACVGKTELLKSKSLESLETDELYELVNSKKLEEKLDSVPSASSSSREADSLMDELPDEI